MSLLIMISIVGKFPLCINAYHSLPISLSLYCVIRSEIQSYNRYKFLTFQRTHWWTAFIAK